MIERIEQQIPLRRWGEADDVADVIVFLASDAARYVTAQTISVLEGARLMMRVGAAAMVTCRPASSVRVSG